MHRTNNAVFIEPLGCWFHESCLPSNAPVPSRIVDMDDTRNIDSMPYELCVECRRKLILGNGRVEMPIKTYRTFILSKAQFVEVEKIKSGFVGKRLPDKKGNVYQVLHVSLQTNPKNTSQAVIMAICEPVFDEKLLQQNYNLVNTMKLIKAELLQRPFDTKQSITEAIAIIDYALGEIK